MVIHDHSQQEAWAAARASRQEEKKQEKKTTRGLSVVAVQSIACVVVVLLALLLRTAGGEAYEQLRDSFRKGLMGNELLATLARWWDGDPLEDVSRPPDADAESPDAVAADIPGRLPPSAALAVSLRVNRPAVPPGRIPPARVSNFLTAWTSPRRRAPPSPLCTAAGWPPWGRAPAWGGTSVWTTAPGWRCSTPTARKYWPRRGLWYGPGSGWRWWAPPAIPPARTCTSR